jgi:hypothetical protein
MLIRPALAAALLALPAAPALADRDPLSGAPLPPQRREIPSPITDRFYIRGTFYEPQAHTNLRLDIPGSPLPTGTALNAERDLALRSRLYQGRVEFLFRLRERGRLRVDYFEADRSGTKVLANTIVFGNQTFAAGSVAQSSLDWKMFDLTYSYSVYRSERLEIGTGLGMYAVEVHARGAVPAQNQLKEVSTADPVPAVPLDITWRLSRRFALTGRAAYLKAALSGFHGWFADLHEDVQYRWNPNFAIGLGYSAVRTSITRMSGNNPGTFALSISGPEAFARFSF